MFWRNEIGSDSWLIANFVQGVSRWVLPAFVMATGALILEPKYKLPRKKILNRTGRFILALIIFGMFYNIAFMLATYGTLNLNLFFDSARDLSRAETVSHLWFLFMFVGLYLVLPLLRVFVQAATKRDIEYFLLLWVIFSLTLPLLNISALKPLVNSLQINLVIGYTGYLLLGYYLKTYDFKPKVNYLLYIIGIICVGITMYGTYHLAMNNDEVIRRFINFLTLNVALTATAVFILCKNYFNKFKEPIAKKITYLSSYTFAIIILHGIFVYIIPMVYTPDWLYNNLWLTPIVVVIIYILTLGLSMALCKIKLFNKILR